MTAAWLAALAGVRPGPRWSTAPSTPGAVVIVGCAGAGKTTAVDAVRAAGLSGVVVPRRFVTRPARQGDHPDEAAVLTPAEFAAAVARGAIVVHWRRRLDGDRHESYGFAPVPDARLPVYSANNAIVDAVEALRAPLYVAIDGPRSVRAARLAARSPDLWRAAPAEVAARLDEPLAPSHAIIDNVDDDPAVVGARLVALVAAVPR